MNIKRLLQFVNLVVLIVLVILFAVNYFSEIRFQKKFENLTNRELKLILSFNEMYAYGLQTGQATRNVLLNPKDDTAIKNYKDATDKFSKAYEIAYSLADSESKKKLKDMFATWEEDHRRKLEVQQLAREGKQQEAIQKLIEETKV